MCISLSTLHSLTQDFSLFLSLFLCLLVFLIIDCSFEVRIGFFPGKKLEDVRREVEDKVAETAKIRNIGYTLEWRGFQAEGCIMDQNVRQPASLLALMTCSPPHYIPE